MVRARALGERLVVSLPERWLAGWLAGSTALLLAPAAAAAARLTPRRARRARPPPRSRPRRFIESGGVYKLVFGPKAFIVVSDPVVVRHLLKVRV